MKILSHIFRLVVGYEEGINGEGVDQWYYTVGLAISCMLAWTYLPDIALTFTILSAIHLISVHVFGFIDLYDSKRYVSYIYLAIHIVLFIIGLITCWYWTLITSVITIVLTLIGGAPNIFSFEWNNKFAMILNTILFFILIFVINLLPIAWWGKIIIKVVAIILHPIIDILEGECIVITDITEDAFYKIRKNK